MIKLRKYVWLAFVLVAANGPRLGFAANSDIVANSGQGKQNNIDIWRLDSSYNVHLATSSDHDSLNLYGSSTGNNQAGDVVLKGDNALPSSSSYPSLKVKFVNGTTTATAIGTVLLASAPAPGSAGYCGTASITATNTVVGVSDGIYAPGAVGYMTIAGYALVLTTGTVQPGNILVSTSPNAGNAGTGSVGYAGVTTGTQVVGTGIGKALGVGTTSGGLTLAIIGMQ